MKLFATRKPREFRHRMIYSRDHEMNFQKKRPQRQHQQNTLLLVVLLILLCVLWYYLN